MAADDDRRMSGASACGACGAGLLGRYCHDCGQDSDARPRPLRAWASEAFSETNLVDGRTARTLVALATRPARLLQAYRDGAGDLYQTPTKLFVVMTALFLLTLNFADVAIYQYTAQRIDASKPVAARADPDGVTAHLSNAVESERWMQKRVATPVDPVVTQAIAAAAERAATELDRQNLLYENQTIREQAIISERLSNWLPNALWLLMPLYALLLIPFFRRRFVMEHLVFALWAHVTAFALLILLALANKLGAAAPAWVVVGPYLAYFTFTAAAYYGTTRLGALWRGVVHLALHVVLVLMPAAIVVAASAMDLEAFVRFIMA